MAKWKSAALGIVAVATLAIASCRQSGTERQGEGGADVGSAGRVGQIGEHWVQNERLRDVMKQISQHAARWPAGVPDDPEASSRQAQEEADEAFRDAAALADGLAAAAKQIPRSVADHPMSAEDRAGFQSEAARLREEALRLRKAARARRVEPMQRSLDAISSTCISCHSRYRDFTGELEPRRASAD